MSPPSNDVGDADNEAEAPDHERNHRSNLERRASGRIDGRSARFDAPAGDEPASGIHRLHPSGDGHGERESHSDRSDVPVRPSEYDQVSAQFTVRQSPWLPPDELAAYYAIDPDFARKTIETIQSAQQARIDAELVPIHAEAWALKVATVGVTFLPWLAAVLAGLFAVLGMDTAALISGLFTVASGGAQILQAVRRPKVIQVTSPQQAATPQLKPKPSKAGRQKRAGAGTRKQKRRR